MSIGGRGEKRTIFLVLKEKKKKKVCVASRRGGGVSLSLESPTVTRKGKKGEFGVANRLWGKHSFRDKKWGVEMRICGERDQTHQSHPIKVNRKKIFFNHAKGEKRRGRESRVNSSNLSNGK